MPHRRNILHHSRYWRTFAGLLPPMNPTAPEEGAMSASDDCRKPGFNYDLPLDDDPDNAGGQKKNKTPSAGSTTTDSDFVSAWTDRLQVLTVLTTFLASMDASLFSLTALGTIPVGEREKDLVYGALAGALIFHVCASILGFTASFVLIRYRIVDAKLTLLTHDDASKQGATGGPSTPSSPQSPSGKNLAWSDRPIVCSDKQHLLIIEPIRPFRRSKSTVSDKEKNADAPSSTPTKTEAPPTDLLSRCYFTCLSLTAAGFVLALLGIMSYAWTALEQAVGIFTTACLGVAVGAGIWAIR
ncbi:hypothetical protein SERLA73DRAFT_164321 [Serpula lacrymans var. lacrymans S7.3]|uniref:Transmembrane protein n=2 Tax=Serpula lacrymans var. lacrymans TaxID=341189 RepID=F8QIJ4_SERL3|nr:uncharacterized protein SERLADRAFT_414384 [Serpula lacrymans var. lacrymans S7.9]EGN91876.1 hypothetical protein SERLA73DRAFT_164321 [Serpula lacrymans var. lacrymans S7.3]EGO26289.1 hypothetical protein SERLADRAFT_414384 [Serpula lacrymans var. lacrymans S7.9]